MLLEAIENAYREATNQPQVPRRGYPIEHILPQAWPDHWPVDGPEAAEVRAEHVHRLGNLTLLTASLNAKVSNGPWEAKRAGLQKHDTLLLNSRLLSAVGGVLLTSRLGAGVPTAGTGFELQAIAACVIGGASLSGARGSAIGAACGALLIGVLNNGGNLLAVNSFYLQIAIGLLILVAVAFDQLNTRAAARE